MNVYVGNNGSWGLNGRQSSKVACVVSEDLNVFPVGIKVECLVQSVCWLAFYGMWWWSCGDLMVTCDGFYNDSLTVTLRWFYDDGLTVTLWWFLMVWDSICGDFVVVSDGLGWLLWWPCGGLRWFGMTFAVTLWWSPMVVSTFFFPFPPLFLWLPPLL